MRTESLPRQDETICESSAELSPSADVPCASFGEHTGCCLYADYNVLVLRGCWGVHRRCGRGVEDVGVA